LNNDVKHPCYVFHDDFLKANLLKLCFRQSCRQCRSNILGVVIGWHSYSWS